MENDITDTNSLIEDNLSEGKNWKHLPLLNTVSRGGEGWARGFNQIIKHKTISHYAAKRLKAD